MTEDATNYLPQPEETVVMPGFPVQTLTTSRHPPPPYSPDRYWLRLEMTCNTNI